MVAQSQGHAAMIRPMATVQGGYFGDQLKAYRVSADISVPQMARRLGKDETTIRRWERDTRECREPFLTMFLTECGVSAHEIEQFKVRNSAATDPVWGTLGVTTDRVSVIGALLRAEQQATKLTVMASGSIPALLQTSGYAAFVMMRDGVPEDDIAVRVAERMGRATMVRERANPLAFDVLLDESVILRSAGDLATTLAQLRHLTRCMTLPHVNIQVVPLSAGWSPAQYGQFSIYDLDSPVAFLELRKFMVFFNSSEDVDGYRASIDQVRPLAMSPEESRGFMLEKIRELEK